MSEGIAHGCLNGFPCLPNSLCCRLPILQQFNDNVGGLEGIYVYMSKAADSIAYKRSRMG